MRNKSRFMTVTSLWGYLHDMPDFCRNFMPKNPSHIYKVSREDGEQRMVYFNADKLQVCLAPGTLELYRIQPGEEEPFTVEYYLEKDAK